MCSSDSRIVSTVILATSIVVAVSHVIIQSTTADGMLLYMEHKEQASFMLPFWLHLGLDRIWFDMFGWPALTGLCTHTLLYLDAGSLWRNGTPGTIMVSGLVTGLVIGVAIGLLIGPVVTLVGGLALVLAIGAVAGLIVMPDIGLIVGATITLIVGLVATICVVAISIHATAGLLVLLLVASIGMCLRGATLALLTLHTRTQDLTRQARPTTYITA